MMTQYQKIRSLKSKKNRKSKENDHILHPHNKKTKNPKIEIVKKILVGKDKEVMRGKETKRKTKIKTEDIEIVNREKVEREKEAEVMTKKEIERKIQNK